MKTIATALLLGGVLVATQADLDTLTGRVASVEMTVAAQGSALNALADRVAALEVTDPPVIDPPPIDPPPIDPPPIDPPPAGGRPTPQSVGVADADLLVNSGSLSLNAGGLIENKRISGTIIVRGPGTIRNCIVDGKGALYVVWANQGNHAVVIEDCEIKNGKSACVIGSNVTMRRCVVWESGGDALKPYSNWLVEDSYFARLGTEPGAHADGAQFVTGGNCVFRRCNFDMPVNEKGGPGAPYTSNAAIIASTGTGPISSIRAEDCWMNGGNYTVYFRSQNHGAPTGCALVRCRFGRGYKYGLLSSDASDLIIEGCVWDDTGEPVPINNR